MSNFLLAVEGGRATVEIVFEGPFLVSWRLLRTMLKNSF
jgi:hypothetical protein